MSIDLLRLFAETITSLTALTTLGFLVFTTFRKLSRIELHTNSTLTETQSRVRALQARLDSQEILLRQALRDRADGQAVREDT